MIEFESVEELYRRVRPALTIKKDEFKRLGYKNIQEEDIWSFLAYHVFSQTVNLTLFDIVSSIMHVDIEKLLKYKEEN